ncbi:hypothetical protein BHE74_00030166 [Ensete ventricosum]|nr:hypothetical protein BHE74_00030166 [Ensete ventricosum]
MALMQESMTKESIEEWKDTLTKEGNSVLSGRSIERGPSIKDKQPPAPLPPGTLQQTLDDRSSVKDRKSTLA